MPNPVYEDDPNEPDTVSSGEIAQIAADARDFGAEDPPADVTADMPEYTQNTNAIASTSSVPTTVSSAPALPGGTSLSQAIADNVAGGILGAGVRSITSGPTQRTPTQRNTQSFIYKATQITSRFQQGRFTQELQGVILNFDDVLPSATNANYSTLIQDQSAAETARLARQDAAIAQSILGRVSGGTLAGETPENTAPAINSGADVSLPNNDAGSVSPAENSEPTTNDGQPAGLASEDGIESIDTQAGSGASQVIAKDD